MAVINSKGGIQAGRDIQVADNGAQIHQHTQNAIHGGQISQTPAAKKENPIIQIIRATLEVVKWWRGGKDDKPGPDQPL